MKFIILFIMFFLHIYDDYRAQGILASMKQKVWWHDNAPAEKYSKDYIMALFEHAFSWAFTITIPWLVMAFVTNNPIYFILLITFYIANTAIHGIVDDLKANKYKINLIQDQSIHFIQILLTWLMFVFIGG